MFAKVWRVCKSLVSNIKPSVFHVFCNKFSFERWCRSKIGIDIGQRLVVLTWETVPSQKLSWLLYLKYSIRERTSAKSVTSQRENKTHYQFIVSVALTYANKRINGSCLRIYKISTSCSFEAWSQFFTMFLQHGFFWNVDTILNRDQQQSFIDKPLNHKK